MPTPFAKSPWLTVEGVVLILLGIAAFFAPLIAGLAAAILFAWILLMAGALGVVSAFGAPHAAHQGWSLLSAAIAIVVGVLLLFNPLIGAVTLSLFIAAYLVLDGAALIGLAFDQRKRGAPGWGWLLATGVLDILLGVFILLMSAIGATVLIGFIIGIDLVAAGVALLAMRRLTGRSSAA